MKKLLFPVFALFLLASASSCTKCVTCKKASVWQKVCDKDADKSDRDNAIAGYEALGYDCKESSQMF